MSFMSSKRLKDVEQDLACTKKITDKRLTNLERDLGNLQDEQNKFRRKLDGFMSDCTEAIDNGTKAAKEQINSDLRKDFPPLLLSEMHAERKGWEKRQEERAFIEKEELAKIRQSIEDRASELKGEVESHLRTTVMEQLERSEEGLAQAKAEYHELGKSIVALSEMKAEEKAPSSGMEVQEEGTLGLEDNAQKEKNGEIIWLNVGGEIFCTSAETLTKSLFFDAALSGKKRLKKDGERRYFIDRNPESFRILLEFLRTDALPKKLSNDQRATLLRDATFYVVPTLQERLDKGLQLGGGGGFAELWRSSVKDSWMSLYARESPLMKTASDTLFAALESSCGSIFRPTAGGSSETPDLLVVYLAPRLDVHRSHRGDELGLGKKCHSTVWHSDNEGLRRLCINDKRLRKMFRVYLSENYGVGFDVFFPDATVDARDAICVLGIFLVGAKVLSVQKWVRTNFSTWSSSFQFDCMPEEEDNSQDMCTIC